MKIVDIASATAQTADSAANDPAAPATVPRVLRPKRAAPADAVRPTRAEINLGHLRHNLRVVQRAAAGSQVYGVLKADAYGHGAPAVARTLERAGIDGFCVALLEEAAELRDAGIRAPILVMGGYYGNAWGEVLARGVTPVIYDRGQAEGIAREIRLSGALAYPPTPVHLKIDTGMGRLGYDYREIGRLLDELGRIPEVRIAGLMTHFACAEHRTLDVVDEQLRRFDQATRVARGRGITALIRHAANSAALLRHSTSRLDIVRPGIALFGISPRFADAPDLRPAMKVRSEIAALRQLREGDSLGYGWTWTAKRASRIATVPMGYADGLPRQLSNKGHMLVLGRRASIVGTVSMDMTMIDVTDHPGVDSGDEAVVLGAQTGPLGSDEITASEIADLTETIPWDVLTSVSRRVPRFYREP
jgi:alanine racemase